MAINADVEVVRYRYQQGSRGEGEAWVKCALIQEGTKYIHVVTLDVPVRVRKVRREERRYMQPLMKKDSTPYPVAAAAKIMLDAGARNGISQAAKSLCERALQQR